MADESEKQVAFSRAINALHDENRRQMQGMFDEIEEWKRDDRRRHWWQFWMPKP